MSADHKTTAFGDPMHERIIEICEAMRAATAGYVNPDGDPSMDLSLIMTAASMFSGLMFGTLVAAGHADDSHREFRRVSESMTRNFKSGIGVGKSRVARMMQTEGNA